MMRWDGRRQAHPRRRKSDPKMLRVAGEPLGLAEFALIVAIGAAGTTLLWIGLGIAAAVLR